MDGFTVSKCLKELEPAARIELAHAVYKGEGPTSPSPLNTKGNLPAYWLPIFEKFARDRAGFAGLLGRVCNADTSGGGA